VYALNQERFEERIVLGLHRPCDINRLSWTLDAIQQVNFIEDRQRGEGDLLNLWNLTKKT